MAAYYPRKSATIEDIMKEFKKFDLETWNEKEEDRLEGLQIAKLRGKGAPKKKRTADSESRPVMISIVVLTCVQRAKRAERGSRLSTGDRIRTNVYYDTLHKASICRRSEQVHQYISGSKSEKTPDYSLRAFLYNLCQPGSITILNAAPS